MKKMLLALALLALPGCGGGAGDGSGGGDAPAGPVEVELWEMMDPRERELLTEHVAAFEAANPDIKVVTTHFGVEDLRTQFLTAALGGGGPDVVYGPSDNIGPFSIARTLRSVEDVFGADFLQQFHPLTHDKLNGQHWIVPEQFGNHLVFLYNKALVAEPPTTTDEMIALAKQHTVDEDGDGKPERYGMVFETKEPFWLVPWLGGYGGWVMDDGFNPTLDSPAMASALAFLRDLKTVHGVVPRDCDYQLADTLFKEGRAAMHINGPWSWKEYTDAGIDLGLCPIPEIPGAGWPSPMVSYRGYAVTKACPDAEVAAARRLVEYLTGPDVQRAYAETMGSLPSLIALQEAADVQEDPVLRDSMAQVRKGNRMPVVPEMRAIWDSMRPQLQNVMNGEATPEDAARFMQEDATRKIAEMKS